ncbi:MAG: FAD-dependent oxidoreductase [Candidatus Odinarchaeum yellowstonii]|uniref:FAD-dependent oxidoreductase n=1 Tax=Odinarchaeota yellowstonii (strain LCB_4) TaxID=1841599 RepID=A0AAF0D399_ODILC|nr:MAG: FAD-dependent oxidoreductase [Candidatus Odinarchaeum yellowstonii]
MRVIIVGFNAAGLSAAVNARKTNLDAEIVVYEKEKYLPYSRCGIPFVISGEVKSFQDLIEYPKDFYDKNKIEIHLNSEVTGIDPASKKIHVVKDGVSFTDHYDKLILALGGTPRVPPIKGIDKDNVFYVRTITDGERILKAAKTLEKCAIIGGGMVGLEMADALSKLGVKVTIIDRKPQILPNLLDEDMTKRILPEFAKRGIKLILNGRCTEIIGEKKVQAIRVNDEILPVDFVIVSTAVDPNVLLAVKAGIELGELGAIKVNMRMETNIKDIYACGDCVELPDLITGRSSCFQVRTGADSMGAVAGINAAGGYSVLPAILIVGMLQLFNLQIAHVGYTERQARQRGIIPIVSIVEGKTKADYYPGAKWIQVKLIFELESTTLIGAQIVGEEGAAMRAIFLSAAMTNKMTASELAKLHIGYTPPLNNHIEPICKAAEAAFDSIKICLFKVPE